jgi:hypothetical protein
LQIFADHCRIPLERAAWIRAQCMAELGPQQQDGAEPWKKSDYARARAKWEQIAATMTERFKAEAKACIERHNLKVFGDAYEPAEEAQS